MYYTLKQAALSKVDEEGRQVEIHHCLRNRDRFDFCSKCNCLCQTKSGHRAVELNKNDVKEIGDMFDETLNCTCRR